MGLQRAQAQELNWQTAESLSDIDLAQRLNPAVGGKPSYKLPDYEYIHRELAKPGMTQQLLWFEYCDQCRASGEIPYQLTQFKTHYREYVAKTKATMHIQRKPGELMEVDWAGQTAHLVDADTGELLDAYIFVAALPYSGYAYTEAFMNQEQEAWITAHANAYSFFGGVTRILTPDNLKTGVIKNTRSELVLNKSYQELAEHYGTAIIPARVRSPKDKATVEGTVGNISSFILASIRNQTFFSLKELNNVIREKLHAFNHKPFQKKDGSRATWFAEERSFLLPLPRNSYELSVWKTATVSFNYHIAVDEQYYSVPYEYIKRNGLQYLLEKEYAMQTITEETKKKVVKLHIQDGRTIASLAAEYGICHATVSNWIRAYREECQTNDTVKTENELMQEVRQLRLKLAEAEKENDFLKKAAAFFAKEID